MEDVCIKTPAVDRCKCQIVDSAVQDCVNINFCIENHVSGHSNANAENG